MMKGLMETLFLLAAPLAGISAKIQENGFNEQEMERAGILL